MEVELEDGTRQGIANVGEIRPLLERLKLETNHFAILSQSDENYIQTYLDRDGFLVEMRKGSAAEHYSAVRGCESSDPHFDHFSLEEVNGLFGSFFEGNGKEVGVTWVKLDSL